MSSETRALVALATLLISPVLAFAQPHPSISLSYGVAPNVARCPDVRAFRAAVAARLGRDPFAGPSDSNPAPHGHLSVSVLRVGRGLRALVAWDRNDGAPSAVREVSVPRGDCSSVVAAAALAISVALDAARTPDPPAPAPPAPPTPRAPPAPIVLTPPLVPPSSAPDPVREPTATARSTLRPWIFLGPVFGAGVSPGVDLGLALDVGLAVAAFGVSVGVRADLPVDTPHAETGGRARTQRLQAELALCWQRPIGGGTIGLHGCALGAATALLGAGLDVDEPRQSTAWLAAAGARAAVDLRLTTLFSLRLRVDALVPIGRAVVRLDQRVVWEGSWVQGAVALGGVLHFQ